MVAAMFQILIGFTGLVGFLLRFVGPLTIAPTITLVGLALFQASADFSGIKNNLTSVVTSFLGSNTVFYVKRKGVFKIRSVVVVVVLC